MRPTWASTPKKCCASSGSNRHRVGFPPSLHPLSIVDGIRASARRTPFRAAVVSGAGCLSYAELMNAAEHAPKHASPVVQWLAAMMADRSGDENRPAAAGLSHRAILLRALDNIVVHAAFDRDGTLATSLSPATASGAVAATLSLWLGGTLLVVEPGSPELVAGIAAGSVHTCWLDVEDSIAFGRMALPSPSTNFRLALCEPRPSARLVEWLGAARVAEPV
jgi:hypothetical protein